MGKANTNKMSLQKEPTASSKSKENIVPITSLRSNASHNKKRKVTHIPSVLSTQSMHTSVPNNDGRIRMMKNGKYDQKIDIKAWNGVLATMMYLTNADDRQRKINQIINMNSFTSADSMRMNPVPFVTHKGPLLGELPFLFYVEDIDELTEFECKKYLAGYGIPFEKNQDIKMKRALARAVGTCISIIDEYKFTKFEAK